MNEPTMAEGRVMRRHPTTKKIDEFADLKDGWDSYGAPRPNPHAMDAARNLFVCPSVRGGIEFEWENGDDCVLFSLAPDGLVDEFYIRANGNEFEWDRDNSGTAVPDADAPVGPRTFGAADSAGEV